MATYSERAEAAVDDIFISRLKQALLERAVAVQNEADSVTDHAYRARLAALVIAYPDEWAHRFAISVANNVNVGSGTSDPTQDSASGDSALSNVIASLWTPYATGLNP